jgi:hypothetical protein
MLFKYCCDLKVDSHLKIQVTNRTLLNFKPLNKIDSVAAKILTTGQSTLEMGHIS